MKIRTKETIIFNKFVNCQLTDRVLEFINFKVSHETGDAG